MYTYFCKLNRLFALLLLIFLSPVLLVTAILVFLFIDKKIFFIQQRVGFKKKIFNIYKFTSMINNSKSKCNLPSNFEEKRINLCGNFLRKYYIDELPQLINVIRGEMNFIGPRPLPIYEDKIYSSKILFWGKRYNVMPGITGYAQVNGFAGPILNNHRLLKRMAYDRLYIKRQNYILDLQIILNTFFIIINNKKKS